MKTVYINKIQHFIVLSMFLHLLLFVAFSSFAKVSKEHQEIDIFIINDVVRSIKDSTTQVSAKKNHIEKTQSTAKSAEDTKIVEEKTQHTILSFPSSHSESLEKKSSAGSISTSNTEKTGIVDAEFGTTYGPKFLYREIPVYPQIARRLGKEGKVVLRLTINEKGELLNVEVIEGAPYGFTESAVEAVKKSKFSPAIKNGKPVACRAILPVRFVLK
ncbi:energy transducer TonB [Thermodesulfovibrio sp. 3907-1M]|uniref:Energy transducer TonB n=1 Tax=Thermodesulfovibrio autotrophicus TaxID=3118333 RepID=A0AAU8GUR8_9BACT